MSIRPKRLSIQDLSTYAICNIGETLQRKFEISTSACYFLVILVLTFLHIYDAPYPQWKAHLLQMLYKE